MNKKNITNLNNNHKRNKNNDKPVNLVHFLPFTSPHFFSHLESGSRGFWFQANNAKPSGCFSINIICDVSRENKQLCASRCLKHMCHHEGSPRADAQPRRSVCSRDANTNPVMWCSGALLACLNFSRLSLQVCPFVLNVACDFYLNIIEHIFL